MNPLKRSGLLVFVLLLVVYLYGLNRTGLLGPDEPRYAAIGQAMARTGDYVAPVLWGKPWFEKPPLLYWTTALGARLGLGPELAPRVPVALLGWGFLVLLWWVARREFGDETALCAAVILGTSIGWLAYSFVAVTDIPLAVCFGGAMLISLYRQGLWCALAAGILLGAAVLAKGLVPLVLFAPVLWPLRKRPRDLAVILISCVVVAAPWYALMTSRFGREFLNDFFWKHHFQRFTTDALAHVRPWWFYLPVLAGAVLPWTPALAAVRRDRRIAFLCAWLVFALIFFSASRNKLPGYILPLLPALALVLASGLRGKSRRPYLICTACLVGFLPLAATVVPEALKHGLSRAPLVLSWWPVVLAVTVVVAAIIAVLRTHGSAAVLWLSALAGITIVFIKFQLAPGLDDQVSARPVWYKTNPVCLPPGTDRDREYGLNYYAGRELPPCAKGSILDRE